jgi:hypothetical protein
VQPQVPAQYAEFVESKGLFEGFTLDDSEPGYLELWAIEDLSKNNLDIEIEKKAPGFLAFAGNGGGEVLAFDSSGAVFMLPLIGMEARYAKKIAHSFLDLARRFSYGSH